MIVQDMIEENHKSGIDHIAILEWRLLEKEQGETE